VSNGKDFMKHIVLVLGLGVFLGSGCGEETKIINCFPVGCEIEAVVKDLSDLDGCGLVLELKDGTRLIPERRTYIQAPTKEDDPIYYFPIRDGQKVKINYRTTQLLGTCMAGDIVFITCISSPEPVGL
jgi:hypothetical protein